MTCHIEIIKDQFLKDTRQAREDWAIITGKEIELKPSHFLDKRTEDKYCYITGALAYPGLEPGCIIILGVINSPKLKFKILEYKEYSSIFQLLKDVVLIRLDYAYGQHEGILFQWIGEQARYQTLVSKISQAIEKQNGVDDGLYIRNPTDWGETYALTMYMKQLRASLKEKRLYLNGKKELINRLQFLKPDDGEKAKFDDFPCIGMLGGLIHTLMIERSWEQNTTFGKPITLED